MTPPPTVLFVCLHGSAKSYGLWALTLYDWGQYAKAWEKVQKAQELRAVIPETFLRMLREKMPEPKRPK